MTIPYVTNELTKIVEQINASIDVANADLEASGGGAGSGFAINVKSPPYNAIGDGVADDTAALQSAIDASKSIGARLVFPAGTYNISDELEAHQYYGFYWEGEEKFGVKIQQTAVNKRIVDGDSISYGVFSNITFTTSVAQNGPLIDLNFTGLYLGLRPQNITFYDCVFQGNGVGLMGVWISRAGGGAQGDNIRFYNCYGNGFTHSVACVGGNNTSPLINSGYAYNGINVLWSGGDLQGNPLYGLASYAGNWIVENVTCENQCLVGFGVPSQTGADFHFESAQRTSVLRNIVSESPKFLEGNAHIINYQCQPSFGRRFDEPLAGTFTYLGEIVYGTKWGSDGRCYKVTNVNQTVIVAYRDIAAPFSTTVIQDPAASYTVNVHVGRWLQVKYPNCYDAQYRQIVSNTATTLTVSPAIDFSPGDGVGQPCGPHSQYRILGDFPGWGGTGIEQATSGSSTTIVKTGAGWTSSEFVGYKCTLMTGKGEKQYGVITANTSDTITVAAGWVTDYELEDLYPDFRIVAPDSTTQFVVEPNWGTQFTTGINGGTQTTFELFDFAVITGAFPSTAATGRIENANCTPGGRVEFAGTIKGLKTTRQDWCTSPAIFSVGDDPSQPLDWQDVRVERFPEQNGGPYLKWMIHRNAGNIFIGPGKSPTLRGNEWQKWLRGETGGGPSYPDLGIGPADDPYANGLYNRTHVIKDGLAIEGALTKRTARGSNQAGEDLVIRGGLNTGSGAPGKIRFQLGSTNATADEPGLPVAAGYIDVLGFHLPVKAFADIGTPTDPTVVFVSDGTAGTPLTGGGTGCLAIFQAGAWKGL